MHSRFQKWATSWGYDKFERKEDRYLDPAVQKVYRAWLMWMKKRG